MDKIPEKSKDMVFRNLGAEALVVNFQSSFFYTFNPVGAFIWERCDGQKSLAQIAAALEEEFEVDSEEAARDCRQFIENLVVEGLLRWAPDQ